MTASVVDLSPQPTTSPPQPIKKKRPFTFGELHHKLIKGVRVHYLMTAELLTLLYFKLGTKTTVQGELPELVRRGYLTCFPLLTSKGNGTYVYYLGRNGIQHCMDTGYDMDEYYHPTRAKEPSYPVLVHTLELNTYLVHAAAFARLCGMELDVLHDFTLRKCPVKVAVPVRVNGRWTQEVRHLIADAFLTFQLPDSSYRWFWHEHDTGEESQKQVKKHLRGLMSLLLEGGYKTAFGAGGMTITYTTSGKRGRLENLRTWTREVLLEHNTLVKQGAFGTAFSKEAGQANARESFSGYFRFTSIPKLHAGRVDTHSLFAAPVWYPPFGEKPTALFPKR